MSERLTAERVEVMSGEEFDDLLDRAVRWNGSGDVSGDLSCMIELWERSHLQQWLTDTLAAAEANDGLRAFFAEQRDWSYETFGPPSFKGPKGPLDHLKKEAAEAFDETDPEKRKVEIVDCLFLVFDAAHRAGMSFGDLVTVANQKMAKNKARTWPDWRGTDPDKAIEHDRSKDDAAA